MIIEQCRANNAAHCLNPQPNKLEIEISLPSLLTSHFSLHSLAARVLPPSPKTPIIHF